MGDNSAFKVNDDGSVTMAKDKLEFQTPEEKDILDIFRIESVKGGALTACRMRSRALKYAKITGISNPSIVVERLLADNYPMQLENYTTTTKLITWRIITVVFFIGFVISCIGIIVESHGRDAYIWQIICAVCLGITIIAGAKYRSYQILLCKKTNEFPNEGKKYADLKTECRRNGFVTFWLWFGIFISIILSAINLNFFGDFIHWGVEIAVPNVDNRSAIVQLINTGMLLTCIVTIDTICNFVGYIMLLKWRKIGFWIIGTSLIFSCAYIYITGQITSAYSQIGHSIGIPALGLLVVFPLIRWIVLWNILQIKKNGITCWSQLK